MNKALENIDIIDHNEKVKTILDLSSYSLENATETIAEAFCDYYSSGNNSKSISKEIINIMKGWF